MDPPKHSPSREKKDSPESAAAAAKHHTHQVDAAAAVAAEPPNHSHLGAMAAEKRAASPTEFELVAARLRRRRTRARPIIATEAPAASSTKPSPSAAGYEATPLSDRNPNISAATDSSNMTKKPDHLGATNSPGSARGAAGEAAAAGGRLGSLKSYKWLGILGEGGFGTVSKARDTRTGDLVAIKSGNGKEEDDGAALLREAALLAACRGNPAVVGLREVVRGPGPDDVSIVMDFPGRSLCSLLDARRRLTESETRGAMLQLLAGVENMGKQGIVHGDLKPDNVLVGNRDGRIILMLCDFGLAVSVAAPPCHVNGTLYYLAPEQLLGDNCGTPVDAWALGCIMAELLTGKPLVEGYCLEEELTKTIYMLAVPDDVSLIVLGVDASTPSKLQDSVPEEVLSPAGFDVLRGLLQYDPEKRLTPAMALRMPWFAGHASVEPSKSK